MTWKKWKAEGTSLLGANFLFRSCPCRTTAKIPPGVLSSPFDQVFCVFFAWGDGDCKGCRLSFFRIKARWLDYWKADEAYLRNPRTIGWKNPWSTGMIRILQCTLVLWHFCIGPNQALKLLIVSFLAGNKSQQWLGCIDNHNTSEIADFTSKPLVMFSVETSEPEFRAILWWMFSCRNTGRDLITCCFSSRSLGSLTSLSLLLSSSLRPFILVR